LPLDLHELRAASGRAWRQLEAAGAIKQQRLRGRQRLLQAERPGSLKRVEVNLGFGLDFRSSFVRRAGELAFGLAAMVLSVADLERLWFSLAGGGALAALARVSGPTKAAD